MGLVWGRERADPSPSPLGTQIPPPWLSPASFPVCYSPPSKHCSVSPGTGRCERLCSGLVLSAQEEPPAIDTSPVSGTSQTGGRNKT